MASLNKALIISIFCVLPFFTACTLSETEDLEVAPVPIAGGYILNPSLISIRVEGQNIIVTGAAGSVTGDRPLAVHQLEASEFDRLPQTPGEGEIVKAVVAFLSRETGTSASDGSFEISVPAGTVGAGMLPPNILGTFVVVSAVRDVNQSPDEIYLSRPDSGVVTAAGAELTNDPVLTAVRVFANPFTGAAWSAVVAAPAASNERLWIATEIDQAGNRYTAWIEDDFDTGNALLVLRRQTPGSTVEPFTILVLAGPSSNRKGLRLAAGTDIAAATWMENDDGGDWEGRMVTWRSGIGWGLAPIPFADPVKDGFYDFEFIDATRGMAVYANGSSRLTSRIFVTDSWEASQEIAAYPIVQNNVDLATRGNGKAGLAVLLTSGASDHVTVAEFNGEEWSFLTSAPAPESDVPFSNMRDASMLAADIDENGRILVFTGERFTTVHGGAMDSFAVIPLEVGHSILTNNSREAHVRVSKDGKLAYLLWSEVGTIPVPMVRAYRFADGQWDPNGPQTIASGYLVDAFEMDDFGNAAILCTSAGGDNIYEARHVVGQGWTELTLLHNVYSTGNRWVDLSVATSTFFGVWMFPPMGDLYESRLTLQ